jgi:hypothetical protein
MAFLINRKWTKDARQQSYTKLGKYAGRKHTKGFQAFDGKNSSERRIT